MLRAQGGARPQQAQNLNIMITVKPNYSKRTFTIRKYKDKKIISKYRTIPMSKQDFELHTYNTTEDWKEFLKKEEVIILK